MTLLIKIIDGKPFEHPSFEGNILQYYAKVPPEYQPFIRVLRPRETALNVYPEESEYQFVDGAWRDVWIPLTLTQEQINERTEIYTISAYATRDFQLEKANKKLTEITDPNQIQIWQNYISELQAWKIENIDPLTPAIPKPPKLVDGVWVARQQG